MRPRLTLDTMFSKEADHVTPSSFGRSWAQREHPDVFSCHLPPFHMCSGDDQEASTSPGVEMESHTQRGGDPGPGATDGGQHNY